MSSNKPTNQQLNDNVSTTKQSPKNKQSVKNTKKSAQNKKGPAKTLPMNSTQISVTFSKKIPSIIYENHYIKFAKSAYHISRILREVGYSDISKKATDIMIELIRIAREELSKEQERVESLFNSSGIEQKSDSMGNSAKTYQVDITSPYANQFVNMIVDYNELLSSIDSLWYESKLNEDQVYQCEQVYKNLLNQLANRVQNLSQGLKKLTTNVSKNEKPSPDEFFEKHVSKNILATQVKKSARNIESNKQEDSNEKVVNA